MELLAASPSYLHRPLGDALLRGYDAKVLIVEGARAVGKSRMMQEQIVPRGYSYATLADAATLEFARTDPARWLRQLRLPAIVDEAQLVDELPLALKEYVDTLDVGTSFILTGSASIGRSGLGGTDPLARRARRTTMYPLTTWEIAKSPGSIVDFLFDGEPLDGWSHGSDDESITRDMLIGGFPSAVFPSGTAALTRSRQYEAIRSGVAATLTDGVLPDTKFESSSAFEVLDHLLRNPGGILNAASTADKFHLDARTVQRYVGLFARLFLVHWLPNRGTSAVRQNMARAKVHPIDTSFSVESLHRAGVQIPEKREAFGALLESHVVNQIVASASWAQTPTTAFYWRHAQHEVDLVLEDGGGRRIGVEVKTASSVRPRDLKGLRALAGSLGLHRGYVVYTGDAVKRLDENLWALPLGALVAAQAFTPPPTTPLARMEPLMHSALSSPPPEPTDSTPSVESPDHDFFDGSLFLSYVHKDNDFLDGNIVQFTKGVVDAYEFLTGHRLEIFVDSDRLIWGDKYQVRLTDEASAADYFIPAVTPRYLGSEACAKEAHDFLASDKSSRLPKLFLPLIWQSIEGTDILAPSDPLLVAINQRQQIRGIDLPSLTPGTPEWRNATKAVAEKLIVAVRARSAASKTPGKAEDATPDPDAPGLLEAVANSAFGEAAEDFKAALDAIGAVFTDMGTLPSQPRAASATLLRVGRRLKEPVADLDDATAKLSASWADIESSLGEIVKVAPQAGPDLEGQIRSLLDTWDRSLDIPGLETVEAQLQFFAAMSTQLRPTSRAITAAIRLMRGIRASIDAWQAQLDR